MEFAINLVYGSLFQSYGGVLGVASSFSYVYFPFINNLPLKIEDKASFSMFCKRFLPSNSFWNRPVTWLIGTTLVSPREANPVAPYNYGFQSWLSRGYSSSVQAYWSNFSLGGIISQSAFFLAGSN